MSVVTGLILAAGESSRTTIHKAIIEVGGKTLLERQVESLKEAGVNNIITVVGYNADEITGKHTNLDVKWITNEGWEYGNFSSILKGLEASGGETLLIPVDVQGVDPETTKTIIETGKKENKTIIPTYNDRGGHPVYLRQQLVEEILEQKKKIGRLDYILREETELIRLPVNTDSILNNLNTENEIEKWKRVRKG